jgi:hypothetical protein
VIKLEYHNPHMGRSNWPLAMYGAAVGFCLLFLSIFAPSLDGEERNLFRVSVPGAVIIWSITRFIMATLRREQNERWIFYVILLAGIGPIWLTVCFFLQG